MFPRNEEKGFKTEDGQKAGQKQKEKQQRWKKADFHICLMSLFTTYTVYNILSCKQQNSPSQALKNNHSDKDNSSTETERQAVREGFFLPLVWEIHLSKFLKPFYNITFSEIPEDPIAAHHHLLPNPNISLNVGKVVERQKDQAPQKCPAYNQMSS